MNKNNRLTLFIGVAVVALLAGLFAWPKLTNPHKALIAQFNKAGIECIASHQATSQHFHLQLTIIVDGVEEIIPNGVGLYNNCMAEIHTHDATGKLHVESHHVGKTFYLKNFFEVWGRSLERDGYSVVMTVDGEANQEFGNLVLKDGQKIILEYKKN